MDNISNKEAAVHVQKNREWPHLLYCSLFNSFFEHSLYPDSIWSLHAVLWIPILVPCGFMVWFWGMWTCTELVSMQQHSNNCFHVTALNWALASGESRWKWLQPLLVEASSEDSHTASSLLYNPEGKCASARAQVTADQLRTTPGTGKDSAIYGATHRWLITVVSPWFQQGFALFTHTAE